MSWVRLDDDFAAHRKVRRLSDAAFRLHVSALCWASKYLTDGHLSVDDLPYVGGDLDDQMDPSALDRTVKELVDRGVWHDDTHRCSSCPGATSGWIIHDFLDLNPSAEQTREQRRQAAERQRRARDRRRDGEWSTSDGPDSDGSRRDKHVTHADVTRESQRPVPYPSPTPGEEAKTPSATTSPTPGSDADPHWVRFWSAYPKKVAKVDARKKYATAIKRGVSPDDVIAGAERYAARVRAEGRDPSRIKNPDGWLNGERWNDELQAAGSAPARIPRNGFQPFRNPTSPDAYNGYHNEPAGDPHAA